MPIIAITDPKDLVIVILLFVIALKLLMVLAYYKGVSDTRKTINGFTGSGIGEFRKYK